MIRPWTTVATSRTRRTAAIPPNVRRPCPPPAIAPAVIAFCVLLPLVEVGRAFVFAPYSGQFVPTAVAAAAVTPLTIHLVPHGLRGTPAPYGRSVLAVLVAVAVGAAVVIGEGWSLMLVFPALAAFLTLPLPWAAAVLVAMEATVLLIGTGVVYLSNAIAKVGGRNRIDAIEISRRAGWL